MCRSACFPRLLSPVKLSRAGESLPVSRMRSVRWDFWLLNYAATKAEAAGRAGGHPLIITGQESARVQTQSTHEASPGFSFQKARWDFPIHKSKPDSCIPRAMPVLTTSLKSKGHVGWVSVPSSTGFEGLQFCCLRRKEALPPGQRSCIPGAANASSFQPRPLCWQVRLSCMLVPPQLDARPAASWMLSLSSFPTCNPISRPLPTQGMWGRAEVSTSSDWGQPELGVLCGANRPALSKCRSCVARAEGNPGPSLHSPLSAPAGWQNDES